MEKYQHCEYLDKVIVTDNLKKTVALVIKALKPHKDKFDAIAFCGMSGALIAPIIALKLNKPMIMVRKPKTKTLECHSSYNTEGYKAAKTYIILDDLVATGKTARYIKLSIEIFSPDAKCLGMFCYRHINKENCKQSLDTQLVTYWMNKI